MSNLPLRPWRNSHSTARRRAAEQALEENLGSTSTTPAASESIDSGPELASMRSLVRTLERLPEQAWNRELDTAGSVSHARTTARSPSRRVRTWITPIYSGVLAAVVIAFVIGALIHPFSGADHPNIAVSRSSARVVLEPLTAARSTSRAIAYMPGGDRMLVHINLPRSAPGTYYELWLMTSTTKLVPVTSFRIHSTGTDSLQLLLPDDPSHYKYLDISVQHVGDEGAISNDSVLRGAIHT